MRGALQPEVGRREEQGALLLLRHRMTHRGAVHPAHAQLVHG